MIVAVVIISFAILSVLGQQKCELPRPNIIIIVADDMGWNDVSFHGSDQIPTPNLDALAYDGVILNRHYVPPMCTPSRASFLTGKYPIHTGLQHYVIVCDEPFGLGLDEKLMPEFFRSAGYRTHMIGKWHLGFHEKEYTPTFRGFDEHVGYLGAYVDYWDHTLIDSNLRYARGHDMRRNLTVDESSKGTYVTTLFSQESERIIQNHNTERPLFLLVNHLAPHSGNEDAPMQAPEEEIAKFAHIKDPNRRILAAMVSLMDQSVGVLVNSLKARGMLENSIILFFSDNGAPTLGQHGNYGSNHPLKGQKNRPFEGAVRVPAFIWSPLLQNNGRISNQWIHNVDWLPTLASAANLQIKNLNLDGINQWESLVSSLQGSRNEIINAIDDLSGYNSLMKDGWKLVDETLMDNASYASIEAGGSWSGAIDDTDIILSKEEYYQIVINSDVGKLLPLTQQKVSALREEATVKCFKSQDAVTCDSLAAPCLFNVLADPCEFNNLAAAMPLKLQELIEAVQVYRDGSEPLRNQPKDPNCDPKYHNFTWTWWKQSQREILSPEDYYATNYLEDKCISRTFWERTITMDIFLGVVSGMLLIIISVFIFLKRK